MSGYLCARLGCGNTRTEQAYVSLLGGRAIQVFLCKKHKDELEGKKKNG